MTNKEATEILGYYTNIGYGVIIEGEDTSKIKQALSIAIKALEAQGWIPVSERLPDMYVDVIVTDIETTETYSAYYLGDGFWECDNGTHKNRIIAWMPFPKPYTKEEQS